MTTSKNEKQTSIPKNHRKKYSIAELELIFSLPPTEQNIKILAKILGRTQKAIKQQYQRAMLSDTMIEEKNKKHNTNRSVDMQCRRVARSMGWITIF